MLGFHLYPFLSRCIPLRLRFHFDATHSFVPYHLLQSLYRSDTVFLDSICKRPAAPHFFASLFSPIFVSRSLPRVPPAVCIDAM